MTREPDTSTIEDQMEVTVFGANGEIVEHFFAEPFRATEGQHSEIIALIEGGMMASDATRLVLGI